MDYSAECGDHADRIKSPGEQVARVFEARDRAENTVANSALFDAIRATLRPDIRCVEVEANINDPGFVAAVFDAFLQIWAKE